MDNQLDNYKEEPVYYCIHCLSLKIRSDEVCDYCEECGSTDIAETTIDKWQELYKKKYGINYINKKSRN